MENKNASITEFLRESNAIEGVYDNDSFLDACEAWNFLVKRTKLTPQIVRKIHRMLMVNQDIPKKYKGKYRDCPVYIGGKKAMPVYYIEREIEKWCDEMNYSIFLTDSPEQRSKSLHIQYEKIHPFIDGNGRTGRMFMNWWRITNGLPILVIHEGVEQMEYYKWFK